MEDLRGAGKRRVSHGLPRTLFWGVLVLTAAARAEPAADATEAADLTDVSAGAPTEAAPAVAEDAVAEDAVAEDAVAEDAITSPAAPVPAQDPSGTDDDAPDASRGAETQPPEAPAGAADTPSAEPALAPAADDEAWIDPAMLQQMAGPYLDPLRPEVNISGFVDVGVTSSSMNVTPQFLLGQFALQTQVNFPSNFGMFAELTLSNDPVWQVAAQRLFLYWEQSDYLKIGLGRYHVPISWWNSTFHHGRWLQTTIDRPLALRYEAALLPNHAIGLTFDGAVPGAEVVGLRYHLSFSGGGHDHAADLSHAADHGSAGSPHVAYTGSLYIEPPALPPLRMGAAGYLDVEAEEDGEIESEAYLGAHLVWAGDSPEFILEYVQVLHPGPSAEKPVYASFGLYAQLGYRLPIDDARWKPYARFDWMEVDKDDMELMDSNSQYLATLGLRYDAISWLALKGQVTYGEVWGSGGVLQGQVQAEAAW